jgi:serine/threonine protein kinase
MSYCLNPYCEKPASNPPTAKFCQSCGTKLLLKDRYRAIKLIGQGGFGKTFLAVDEDKPSKPPCVIKQFFLKPKIRTTPRKRLSYLSEKHCGWMSWANTIRFQSCSPTLARIIASI